MDLQPALMGVTPSAPIRRNRQFPDHVWDDLRQELVDMYVGDDIEIKEISRTLAARHNITITSEIGKQIFR